MIKKKDKKNLKNQQNFLKKITRKKGKKRGRRIIEDNRGWVGRIAGLHVSTDLRGPASITSPNCSVREKSKSPCQKVCEKVYKIGLPTVRKPAYGTEQLIFNDAKFSDVFITLGRLERFKVTSLLL